MHILALLLCIIGSLIVSALLVQALLQQRIVHNYNLRWQELTLEFTHA